MSSDVKRIGIRVGLSIGALWLGIACFGDADKLFSGRLAQQTTSAGGAETQVSLGRGRDRVELLIPAEALATRAEVQLSVVSGTVRRGRYPVTDTALLVEPQGLAFARPARLRQLVPPPPLGRRYRTVVVPDGGASFVAKGLARRLGGATAETEGHEPWESDCEGSGLWGLALDESGDEGSGSPIDAGSPDAGASGAPACKPATSEGCGATEGCIVSCVNGEATNRCAAAGLKQPGALCSGAEDCAPGSVCQASTCGVKICRRYCDADDQCPQNTRCALQLTCSTPVASPRLCSQACDPRGTARTGCAEGLRCLLFPGEITTCGCVSPQSFGVDGAACTTTGNCAPGFVCINTGSPVCRPVCRLDEPTTCTAGRTCQKLIAPESQVFGACAP